MLKDQKTVVVVITVLVMCGLLLVMGALYGCAKGVDDMDGTRKGDKQGLPGDLRIAWDEAKYRRLYPEAYNVIPVSPRNPAYHSKILERTQDPNEAAYHIIALGLLGQDTQEVRAVLVSAAKRFRGTLVPRGYEWPDIAEKFRQRLRQDTYTYNHYIVDHYPGNRRLSIFMLVRECLERINGSKPTEVKEP